MSSLSRPLKALSGLIADTSLTKKAYLNAVNVVLDHIAYLIVGFILTPLMVGGLGNYFYGMWQILNRLIGYISPASGRPGFALKATLAYRQASTDYDQKRRYVASTIVIWVLFLPVLGGIGGIVCWYVPVWVHAPANYVWIVRAAAAVLVINMIVDALSSVPQVTLQGENLGYKRMGTSVLVIFVGGGFFTWLALYLKAGIIGIAVAVVAKTMLIGLFYLAIVRKHAPWFGLTVPHSKDIRHMLGLSWWFMASNFVNSALLASDVVVLGLLGAVESVTNYSLTKIGPETLVEVIVIVVYGVTPGFGSIIGTGDHQRAFHLRGEIMQYIWLFSTAIGASLVLWNGVFVQLWVGADHYSGLIPNLLVIIAAIQLAFIRSDSNILDLTLRLKPRVLLGALSVVASVSLASIAVGWLHLGVVGLCFGIISGRIVISVAYPALISRFLNVPLSFQLRASLRPAVVSILLFAAAFILRSHPSSESWSGASDWLSLVFCAALTVGIILMLAFLLGLTRKQQNMLLRRIMAGLAISPDSDLNPYS